MFAGEVVNRAEPMFQLCQALRIQIEPFDDATRAVGRLADLGEGGFGDVERLAKSLMQRRQPGEPTLRADALVVGTVPAAQQKPFRLGSGDRRGGHGWASTCRSRWLPDHK